MCQLLVQFICLTKHCINILQFFTFQQVSEDFNRLEKMGDRQFKKVPEGSGDRPSWARFRQVRPDGSLEPQGQSEQQQPTRRRPGNL